MAEVNHPAPLTQSSHDTLLLTVVASWNWTEAQPLGLRNTWCQSAITVKQHIFILNNDKQAWFFTCTMPHRLGSAELGGLCVQVQFRSIPLAVLRPELHRLYCESTGGTWGSPTVPLLRTGNARAKRSLCSSS